MIGLWLGSALAGILSGAVTDSAGDGVADVQVVAYDHRFTYGSTLTDADGRFELDLPDNQYRLRLIPPEHANFAEQWVPDTLEICEATSWALDDVEAVQVLREGGVLSGRITDEFGGGLPDLELAARTTAAQPRALSRTGSTDADGFFQIKGLPADNADGTSGSFILSIDGPDLPAQFFGAGYLQSEAPFWEVTPGQTVDVMDHEALPGVGVSGAVDGPDGPILIGTVNAFSPSELVTVDVSAGTYVALGLPPGQVLTWARAPGFATTYLKDSDRPDERILVAEEGELATDLDLTLPLESRLSGRLLAPTDLDGASVQLTNSDGTVGVAAVVDSDGGFVVEALHPGTYALNIFAADEGYLDGPWLDGEVPAQVLVGEGDTDLGEIPLVEGARVEGVATDPYTQDPVYGAVISAVERDTGEVVVDVSHRDGTFELLGLAAGVWEIDASFNSWCTGDPDYVDVFYPDHRTATLLAPVALAAGDVLVWNPEMPGDADHDDMPDQWEAEHGLDPGADDSANDADGDGYSNLDEYLLGTDPGRDLGRGCACQAGSHPSAAWLLLTPLSLLRRRG